jgi:heme/copper-type cytochrome/quinol oxidase subunit 1
LVGYVWWGLSIIIRVELLQRGVFLGEGQAYNSLVRAHALLIIFFIIIPTLIGVFGNWFIPLLIGREDLVFPRLNNFRFWLLVPSLSFLVFSMFLGGAGAGWTIYPPLSRIERNSMDILIFSLHLAGLSSVFSSINFISTILGFRFLGLNLGALSVFVWSILVTVVLLVLAVPALAGAITILFLDRNFNFFFF